MIVPIDLLKPILSDLRSFGRVNKPARPWLGLFASDFDDKVVVMGVADKGPAGRSGIQSSDVILAVNGDAVSSLAEFYRKVWTLGIAGVDVPLTISHEGITFDVVLASTDRTKLLKAPRLH
jgi:S1-C subfamily serine protease